MPAVNKVAVPANSAAGPCSITSCRAPNASPLAGKWRSIGAMPKGSDLREGEPP